MNDLLVNLRSFGQVMFQNSSRAGGLFLLGIGISGWCESNYQLVLSAIICSLVANGTAKILAVNEKNYQDGLYGYNAVLIGIAGAVFLNFTILSLSLLLMGTILSVLLMFFMMEKIPKSKSFPLLTFPFVIVTWMILFIAKNFLPHLMKASLAVSTPPNLIEGILKSYSQVFLLGNTLTGGVFLLAIWISSRTAGWISLVFTSMVIISGYGLGVEFSVIGQGLFGYNVVLTAIALGSVFIGNLREALRWTIVGVFLTIGYQELMTRIFMQWELPILTAPFVFAVWSVLVCKNLLSRILK